MGMVLSVMIAALQVELAWSQKRARPAMADLEMLISDQAAAFHNPESPQGTRNYDNLITLASTLKRLQDLDKYYSHQARPRYRHR